MRSATLPAAGRLGSVRASAEMIGLPVLRTSSATEWLILNSGFRIDSRSKLRATLMTRLSRSRRMRKPRSAPAISITESMISSRSFLRLCSELMSLLMSSIR